MTRGPLVVTFIAVLLVVMSEMSWAGSSGLGASSTVSSGGKPVVEYGRVLYVADGDTIDVAVDGTSTDPDGDRRPGTRIRFLATQAMELHTYHHDLSRVTGECHAVEAAQRLASLLMSDGTGRRVRLTARDATSSNLGRSARFVATQGTDGNWHDVGAVLVREGQVVPSYQRNEYTWNSAYRKLSQAAAADGVGIWDRDTCGAGPAATVSVRVHWDAEGNDAVNVNGEYVRVTNRGPKTVNLAGWWVRDSATRAAATLAAHRRGFILPAGATVAPGRSLLVHVGKKPQHPAADHYYYGQSSPIFENPTDKPSYLGDGAYLFDPDGDLRAWQQYPCVSERPHACTG
jgi:endonuclease YncB( thermonuclease family)